MEVQHGLGVAHQHFDRVTTSSGGFSIDIARLKAVNELELDTNGFWIACFSQNGDDLGQWRNYADDGRGVCLGFSVDALDVTEFAARLGDKMATGYSLAVNYQDDYFVDSVGQYVDIGKALLQEIDLPSQSTERARLCEERVLRAISKGLYANSIKFKHHSYRREQEYRLLVTGSREAVSGLTCHKLREGRGEIVSYLCLSVPRWKQAGVLTHIRVGPAGRDRLVTQLRLAVQALRIPPPECIDQSSLPYRSVRNR